MSTAGAFGTTRTRFARGAAIVIVFVGLAFALPLLIDWINPPALVKPFGIHHYSWMATFVVSGVALLLLAMALLRRMGPVAALRELGFLPVAARPIELGLGAIAIMVAILIVIGPRLRIDSVAGLIFMGILGPISEELLFRGFAFRELRRWVGAPFWLAATISSLMFGAVHLSQGASLTEALAVMGVTAVGGFLFCWVTERWQSLWLGIVMHVGLNVGWTVFGLGDNALGDWKANAARLAPVVVAIGGTLVLTRRQSLA